MDFFIATINNWQNLFLDNNIKDLLTKSLDWLVENNKASIHGFVIMPNHFHVLWTVKDDSYDLGARFKSFTGSAFLEYLKKENPEILEKYISTQNDRFHHFWERRSRSIEMLTYEIAAQKLDYIHKNPLQEKWKLVEFEEDYVYSSAAFYLLDDKKFTFLTRIEEYFF